MNHLEPVWKKRRLQRWESMAVTHRPISYFTQAQWSGPSLMLIHDGRLRNSTWLNSNLVKSISNEKLRKYPLLFEHTIQNDFFKRKPRVSIFDFIYLLVRICPNLFGVYEGGSGVWRANNCDGIEMWTINEEVCFGEGCQLCFDLDDKFWAWKWITHEFERCCF